jgi:hypothetical protein
MSTAVDGAGLVIIVCAVAAGHARGRPTTTGHRLAMRPTNAAAAGQTTPSTTKCRRYARSLAGAHSPMRPATAVVGSEAGVLGRSVLSADISTPLRRACEGACGAQINTSQIMRTRCRTGCLARQQRA